MPARRRAINVARGELGSYVAHVSKHHVLIVGTGFAGLGMAIRLKQAGIEDFTILERAPGVGGTWRDNHYPGAACDVESHLYSFSFEPNPDWSRMFAQQAEILAYLEHCTDKYGIRKHIRFNAAATRAAFNERSALWEVEASDGTNYEAQVLVLGCGGLSRPSVPDIPGLSSFEGKQFHSARWDHAFPFEGKTVAVIGTGASAIQIVPEIAPKVEKLHLFQRTPPWIMPRPDRAIALGERALFRRAPITQRLARSAIYLIHELMAVGFVVEPRILQLASTISKRYLRKSISDPVLREKLTPTYAMGCKRILLGDGYYDALAQKNVELVTEGIERVHAHGIRTKDGNDRKLDAIVLATGFNAAESCAPFEVRGRGGRDLNEEWRDGAEAYLGTAITGFPNLFMIVGPNTGLGHSSMVYMIESQIQYIMSSIETMRARRLTLVDVRADAQTRYNKRLHARLAGTVWATGCSSWYRTRTGKNTVLWPGFTFEFRYRTRRFDPDDYDLVSAS